MEKFILFIAIAVIIVSSKTFAQEQVKALANQRTLLQSHDSKLAKNKKLVYDFWREVVEGNHLELANKYLNNNFISHSIYAPSGIKAFVDSALKLDIQPGVIIDSIRTEVVSIVAENDLVILSFVQMAPDTSNKFLYDSWYSTTAFKMFRIEDGKIAEYWDTATKQ